MSSDVLNYKRLEEDKTQLYKELTEEIITYFENNISNLFRTKRDIDVAFSVIELMKQRETIENYNKKALYILIREMTNVETTHITKVINIFKKEYKKPSNR